MEFENLVKLIKAVSESELTRFSYEENGVSISMKKDKKKKLVTINNVGETAAGSLPATFPATGQMEFPEGQENGPLEGNVVKSPLVGTFYSSPGPDSEPFVKVGDYVSKGQVLGIVEAMKLMNEIESDYEGTVKQVLVSNEDVIEYGQALFVVG